MRVEEVSQPGAAVVLDAIGRELGEQCGMPDCIECSIHILRYVSDLISDIEGLHPLLGEQMQHVHATV